MIEPMGIRVLDPQTVSRIAAGEVVERSASVVKELVENSLDAGATQISVEVSGGGVSLIRVVDNGSGIPREEVELAFERHATSKISRSEDLDAIATLGFRGEALPSIAAVAEVEMVTRTGQDQSGSFVSMDNGAVVDKGSRGRSPGTTVTVRNLFRKVPARLKFLKSPATENSHCASVVTQYALAFPEVRFSLSLDGRSSLRTPGSGRLLDAAVEAYGLETARNMMEIAEEETSYPSPRVSGLVGTPALSRSGRDYLSFFINRRWVNSRLLTWAVEEAYHGLLREGRHPVAIINVSLAAGEVDVNIHPGKTEVKFQHERAVFGAVQKAVRQTVVQQTPVPRIEETVASYGAPRPLTAQNQPVTADLFAARHAPVAPPTEHTPAASLPVLRVLGQLSGSYIVAEGPDGLYLIDQHAAHERICFEKIAAQRAQRDVTVQGLLQPLPVEISPRQEAALRNARSLAEFGFSIDAFGERTWLVRAVPEMLHDKDWKAALLEILDSLSGGAADNWQERVAMSMACHGAIRAGQLLSHDEMREMVRQLEQTSLPNTCPHGRPTIVRLSSSRLDREFGRS